MHSREVRKRPGGNVCSACGSASAGERLNVVALIGKGPSMWLCPGLLAEMGGLHNGKPGAQ